VDRPPWAPDEVDITAPSVARVYDYYLGGSHNFASDRAFGQAVVAVYPAVPAVARQNRSFLRRAVQYLATEIAALFGGLTLVDPGLVPVPAWRPCPAEACEVRDDHHPMLGGLGRQD
jgi:hypothetical protein